VEAMRLEHHLSLSEQKWSLTNPDAGEQRIVALSHKAKRSMIVKKIQQTLMKHRSNPSTIIIKGFLEKKSDVNVSWAQRYCLMTVKDFRYFYTPDDFKKDPDNPLGIIPLRAIYMILPLNDKEEVNKQNAFQISTSMWIKKQTEMEERKFYFAGLNEEVMEEWTIYLEFSRSMAMYD
jgi:adenylate cyclase 10